MQKFLRRKHILFDDILRVCRALFVRLFRSYIDKTTMSNWTFLQNYRASNLQPFPYEENDFNYQRYGGHNFLHR